MGDIENQILDYDGIREIVVIDREHSDGEKYLCAYYVAEREISVTDLRSYLALHLPEYMIPAYLIGIEKMPLTPNGKIDRKAFPEPDFSSISEVEYVAPRNEIESKLARIWSEILGLEKVGVQHNFFSIGGHSLKATAVVLEVYKEFNVELPLKVIFKSPTIEELATYISRADESIYNSIKVVKRSVNFPTGCYPVSSAQMRLYLLNQLEGMNTSYNISGVFKIAGQLDKNKFEKVVKDLIKRHDAFRTSFEMIDGEVIQRIHEDIEFAIDYINDNSPEDAIKEFIRPFDLSKAPLFRVGLIEGLDQKLLVFDMHHIISDGTSMEILFSDFVKLYMGIKLTDLRIQYKDFALWQNDLFNSDVIRKQEEYWLNIFSESDKDQNSEHSGPAPVLNMPTDYPRPSVMSFEGDSIPFNLEKEFAEKLNKLANENGATLYMVLLAAYNLVLSKYTGQEDIIVGSPIAGRSHADLKNIIGMFVNTLAMRNQPKGKLTFLEFLDQVKENAFMAYENQDYQFEMLVDKLELRRDMSRNPLFDTMFVLQNMQMQNIQLQPTEQRVDDLRFIPYEIEKDIAKFDLTLKAWEVNGEIHCNLQYWTRLFKRETIERFVGHFINTIKQIALNSTEKLMDINMLSEEEKSQLIYEFNDTLIEYPSEKTLDQVFEEQVTKTPDNIALLFENHKLTYNDLNQKANQVARILREKGVKSDKIVALMVERSLEMFIGIIAVLKAGGAYMPISTEYPEERIAYMLKDSQARLLLVGNDFASDLKFDGEVIDLTDQDIYTQDGSKLESVRSTNDLAYLLYTSGSTGKPKGVMVEDRSVLNTLNHLQMRYPLDSNDIILQSTTYTFDASVREIFWWFFNGAKCCLLRPDGEKDPEVILETIASNKVTVVKFVPILLNEVLTTALEMGKENLSSLKYVFVGGEALSGELVKKFYQVFSLGQMLCNLYGPTETTIHCTEHELTAPIEENQALIGRPISNVKVYVFDKWLKPVAKGVVGEIYVSGINVARGYINNLQLTAERFIQNPYISGERLYKTGDLGRWLADGTLEFMGRVDHQVKIRGFRVELGEIENQLLTHPCIKETVVTVHQNESGDKSLCAYLVTDEELTSPELKDYLSKRLARYMIPAHYIILDKMPLTVNGKINRRALPDPDGIDRGAIVAPRNPIEIKLLQIWIKRCWG